MSTPPPLTVDDFWLTLTTAWSSVRGGQRALSGLSHRNPYLRRLAVTACNVLLPDVLKALERRLRSLSADQLRQWDAHLNSALAELDRPDVQNALKPPSDECFLYARAWVVVHGREYYGLVLREPGFGVKDQWAEGVLYVAVNVYEKRYGKWGH